MVKQIIWTKLAQQNRKTILEYWTIHNKSTAFSKRLNRVFEDTIDLLSKHPKIGKKTEYPDIRVKIIKDYCLTYRETEFTLEILTIWDSRQDPEKFERILKK
jgi:plasmid stabilization system protein ParE